MTTISARTRSLRRVRAQAYLPKVVALVLVLVLSAAGVRAIVAPRPRPLPAPVVTQPPPDQGAESFAESFIRVYLTWDASDQTARESALRPFLSSSLDEDAGVQFASAGSQSVSWTSVVAEQRAGAQTLVTVAAQTTSGLMYLSVPVVRDAHGFMFIPAYPAIVGPPASNHDASLPAGQEVSDGSLQAVVARAVTNYLAGSQANLLADLTPDALVSLPLQRMTVTDTQPATWIVPGRRVAIQVTATGPQGTSWTLTYDMTVKKLDRWYVQSIEVDPTFQGGSR